MLTVFGRRHYYAAVLTSALLISMSSDRHAQASSPDAWEEFQQKVEQACVNAAHGVLEVKRIQVDPYGSESYGFAVVYGTEAGGTTERLIVCAYDKTSEAAEISSPFDK